MRVIFSMEGHNMNKNKIKKRLEYNLKAYGAPKLVNAEHLDETKFRYTTENIAETAVSYFKADPEIWEFPAKNYFVRICLAYHLSDTADEYFDLLNDNSILPYDDRYSKTYSEDPETYDKIFDLAGDFEFTPGYAKTIEIFGYLYDSPLHGKKLTVGYNATGQEFFDTIAPFKNDIEEFFFSFTHTMPKAPLKYQDVYLSLMSSNHYGIPANLLLNTEHDQEIWEREIEDAIECSCLQAVTVLDLDTARKIKAKYPWLKIHISTHGAMNIKLEDLDRDLIYAFNANEPYWQQERPVIDRCRELGIIVKYIVNRGCVFGKHDMMSKVSGRDIMCCYGYQCQQLMKEQPWLSLTRTNLFKEQVKGIRSDILKISTRERTNKEIRELLTYFTNLKPSQRISMMFADDVKLTDSNYPYFLDWVNVKQDCSGECAECRKCEKLFKEIKDHEEI